MTITNEYEENGYLVREYSNGTVEKRLISVDEGPTPERTLTRLAFRNRFTMEEKVAIYEAAKVNTMLQVFLDDLATSHEVDLDFQGTVEGVHALEQFGIIGEGRAQEILA